MRARLPDDNVLDRFGPDLPLIREWTEAHYEFAGYVTGFDPKHLGDRAEVRAELEYRPDEKICIVTVGGSGVGARVASEVCPTFFALGASGAVTTTLDAAGFVDIDETRLTVDLEYPTDEAALGAAFLGGPVALAYSRFDDDTRRSAHLEYLASLANFTDGAGYRVPGEFVIASELRPRTTDLNTNQERNIP